MPIADSNPLQNERDFSAFSALIYVQFGAIVWNYATTFSFDWAIFRGKNPWAWPMVPCFVTRYGSFIAMIPLIMQINAFNINCSHLWPAIIVGVRLQKLGAEVLFSLRAMALWEYNWYIAGFVSTLWLATAVIGLLGIMSANWIRFPSPAPGLAPSCIPIKWAWELGAAYILTLIFAIVIIFLVVYRLKQMGRRVHSSLSEMIYRDGIIFLIMAIVPSVAAVILFYAGRTPPAQSASMTLAARAYRNLSDLCERLLISMRLKVSNGTKLDADTLSRIAFIMGAPQDHNLEQGQMNESFGIPEFQDAFAYETNTKEESSWNGSPNFKAGSANAWNTSPELNSGSWNNTPALPSTTWTATSGQLKKGVSADTQSLSNQSNTDNACTDIHIITQQEIMRESCDSSQTPF